MQPHCAAFFRDCDQSDSPEATGYKGFYFHFLDMHTGALVWRSELSVDAKGLPAAQGPAVALRVERLRPVCDITGDFSVLNVCTRAPSRKLPIEAKCEKA